MAPHVEEREDGSRPVMRAEFGEFVLDANKRELTRNGEARHLTLKAFFLLELLIRSAPRALTKEEMYHHIWGDTFVEEANLPNLVSEIRSALDESRKNPRFIRTVHGFGYAFDGEVQLSETAREDSRPGNHMMSLRWRREEFPLQHGENIVGRASDADVEIDSGSISRHHARIVVTDDAATIEDLGSKNGTFVGEKRIKAPTGLESGDEIRFGVVAVTFRMLDKTATTVTEMES